MQEPPSGPVLAVGAKALLKNQEGKYLLLRRNPHACPSTKELWDIPGGRIHAGVPLLENLKQEIYEETKLVLSGAPELIAAQDIILPYTHIIRLTYTGTADGNPILNSEHTSFWWADKEEIKSLPPSELDPYMHNIFEKIWNI